MVPPTVRDLVYRVENPKIRKGSKYFPPAPLVIARIPQSLRSVAYQSVWMSRLARPIPLGQARAFGVPFPVVVKCGDWRHCFCAGIICAGPSLWVPPIRKTCKIGRRRTITFDSATFPPYLAHGGGGTPPPRTNFSTRTPSEKKVAQYVYC